MRGLRRLGAAAALCAVASPAAAYVRTTTSETSYWLFWNSRRVEFVVNKEGTRDLLGCTDGPAQSVAAAEAAFNTWTEATVPGSSEPCTDFELVPLEPTERMDTGYDQDHPGDNINLVIWRQGDCNLSVNDPCHKENTCGNAYNCWDNTRGITNEEDTLALATVSYVVSTGEIIDADIELHGWMSDAPDDGGYYYTCVAPGADPCAVKGDPSCIGFDVQNVVTHEVGHVLGLSDLGGAESLNATMFRQAGNGETKKRDLEVDDVVGVCAVYPRGGRTPTSVPMNHTTGGCGSGAAGSMATAVVAAYALLRRRRTGQ